MNDDTMKTTTDAGVAPRQLAERDLDRMLDLAVPPPPSETLRARLKRDFQPALAAANALPDAGNGPMARFAARYGAVVVAASLVVAVALAVTTPPDTPAAPARSASSVASFAEPVSDAAGIETAAVADDETFAAETFAAETFAQSAPDSTEFMLAALTLAGREATNGDGSAPFGAEPSFEGVPLE